MKNANPNSLFLLLVIAAISVQSNCISEPKKDNTLNIRLEAAPNVLNPYLTNVGYSLYVCNQIFNTLGNLNPKTLKMEPSLVVNIPEVQVVADGPHKGTFRYDFEIHAAAVWENGTPVTAKDIIFTFKTILHPGLPSAWASYYDQLRLLKKTLPTRKNSVCILHSIIS
jgi:peptide/nickel transport system substrate-binding protein